MDIGTWGIYICLFLALYFEVFLLISFFEKRPSKKTKALPAYYPSVAILVPCWNKGATLAPTIDSLLALDYPKEKLSVVIIDDGSTDNTFEAAQAFANNPQVSIYQKQNEGSKYSALNFGLAHSDSELVGCLDADSFVEKDALTEMVKTFVDDATVMAAAPVMKVNSPRNLLELMQSVEYTFGIFYKKMFDNINAISVLPGPFSIYRRSLFEKIGLFRKAHHTEDMEMAFRMHSYGLKLVNVHTAFVYTNVPTTVGALIRQRTRWSRGFLENSRDYSYMYFNRSYGNFGMMTLPLGLAGFVAGLYTAGYTAWRLTSYATIKIMALWQTHIPISFSLPLHQPQWLYVVDTSMLSFLIVFTFSMTLVAIFLGQRIADTKLSVISFISYFLLYGFVAPFWLARAGWDTVLSKERGWLT
jgi:cellulose synthase/poly-beta-1,6-N-acetylglucosamine synthase-like glycosyltransferase